jgi:hypothetical protein
MVNVGSLSVDCSHHRCACLACAWQSWISEATVAHWIIITLRRVVSPAGHAPPTLAPSGGGGIVGGMKQILLMIALVALVGCGEEIPEGNYGQDDGGAWEYVAESPSGQTSPVFSSHDAAVAYTKKNSDDFGTGTVIYRGPAK